MANCRDIDPLVTPYVDGEAPPGDQAVVATHLAACPPCRERTEAEGTAREVLRTRGRELVRACAPADLRTRCARTARRASDTSPVSGWRARTVPLAMAATVLLVVGITAVVLSSRSTTVLAAQLTLDHVKCWEHVDESARVDTRQLENRMEQRLGWHIQVAPGSDDQGLQLVTARRCQYADSGIAHIMYRHLGRPVSLYMLPDRTLPTRKLKVMGHEAVIWSVDGRSYLLVAREPRVELERVAAYVRPKSH